MCLAILSSYLVFTQQESGHSSLSFLSFLYSLGVSAPTVKLVVVGLIILSVLLAAYLICWWIMSGIDHENIGRHPVQGHSFFADGPYCPVKFTKEKKKW